jgi:hypothetical protein
VKLELLELQLQRREGPLVPQIQAALAGHGEPLRWAITAVHQGPSGASLQIEAVMVQGSWPLHKSQAGRTP